MNNQCDVIYFDAFSGASGDMILSSLIHLGVSFDYLIEELKKLPLDGYSIRHELKKVSGIEGIKLSIEYPKENKHRHLSHIQKIINDSTLDDVIKLRAIETFEYIAIAEAKVHGTSKEKIHFHEVGAMDSIIDIVGCSIALHSLGITNIMSSPLPLGRGFIKCDHGVMPLPAPATLEILKDYPSYGVDREGEFVTPTGAAVLKTWVRDVQSYPDISIHSIGYGVGSIEREIPNLLRVIMGKSLKLDTLKKNSF